MAKLTDTQITAICEAELNAASGDASGELSEQRADAMEYYLGEPYGDESDGRSQVRTREVLETVEWILPSLLRIFTDTENAVVFDPVGAEDESAAEQETDRVNHCFWKENAGFYNLYAFCKDALLSKVGVLKFWWDDDTPETREEYQGLNDVELAELLSDPTVEREVLEYEQTARGWDIAFRTRDREGRVRVEPVPPEEFGVNRNARTPHVQDCTFVYHRSVKTYSQLIEMGYPRKLVETLPFGDEVETEERLARRHLQDEQEALRAAAHKSMRTVWVTECYIRLDRDDDGIAELLKVTLATGGSNFDAGTKLLEVEEVDHIPFATVSPIPLTHKFHGLSIADLVMDLQRIRSTLLRGILDNTYLANNPGTAVNDLVNLDDLLTSRPGRVVRVEGDTPPGQAVSPLLSQPLPPQVFEVWQGLEGLQKQRTGVGDDVAALDKASLANVNTGVAALAYDAARARVELIARIIAEMGLRPLFLRIHELLQKHSTKPQAIRLRNEWVHVDPSQWRHRKDMTVMVGMGQASKERRLMALDAVLQKQALAVEGGALGSVLMPEHIYSALADWTECLGLRDSARYWQDPRKAPPMPDKPDPQMLALQISAQAEQAKAQAAMGRNQVDAQKAQIDAQLRQAELAVRREEAAARAQIERLKSEIKALEVARATEDKAIKTNLDATLASRKLDLEAAKLALDDQRKAAQQVLDQQEAALDAAVRLSTAANTAQATAETSQADAQRASGDLAAMMAEMRAQMVEVREAMQQAQAQAAAPREIVRDANGLIVSIGNARIERDASGLATRING